MARTTVRKKCSYYGCVESPVWAHYTNTRKVDHTMQYCDEHYRNWVLPRKIGTTSGDWKNEKVI